MSARGVELLKYVHEQSKLKNPLETLSVPVEERKVNLLQAQCENGISQRQRSNWQSELWKSRLTLVKGLLWWELLLLVLRLPRKPEMHCRECPSWWGYKFSQLLYWDVQLGGVLWLCLRSFNESDSLYRENEKKINPLHPVFLDLSQMLLGGNRQLQSLFLHDSVQQKQQWEKTV